MTGWIIFGCIMLLILFLLFSSVSADIDYDEQLKIKVKYLFFTIFPLKKRKKKKKKGKAERKKATEMYVGGEAEESENTDAEGNRDKQETAVQDTGTEKNNKRKEREKKNKNAEKSKIDLHMIKQLVSAASPPVKRLFRKIRLTGIYIEITCASDDAAKTALDYGKTCAVVNSFFAFLSSLITVKIDKINIKADFDREKSEYKAHGKIRLRVSTALACGVWLAFRAASVFLKMKSGAASFKKGKTSDKESDRISEKTTEKGK